MINNMRLNDYLYKLLNIHQCGAMLVCAESKNNVLIQPNVVQDPVIFRFYSIALKSTFYFSRSQPFFSSISEEKLQLLHNEKLYRCGVTGNVAIILKSTAVGCRQNYEAMSTDVEEVLIKIIVILSIVGRWCLEAFPLNTEPDFYQIIS
jgi:hypothetical protein